MDVQINHSGDSSESSSWSSSNSSPSRKIEILKEISSNGTSEVSEESSSFGKSDDYKVNRSFRNSDDVRVDDVQIMNLDEINEFKTQDDQIHASDSEKANFVTKVFLLHLVQVLICFLFNILSTLSNKFRDFVHDNWWIIIISSVLGLLTMIVFLLSKKSRKIFPFNYILLLIFYLLLGFTTAAASTYEGDKVVLMVFGIALGTMITLTIYSFLKRENIVISIGIVIVIIFAIILFILLIVFIGADKISILIICPFSVIYYGIFVILETKIIIEKNIFGTDYNDYIVAVIYVDSKIISTFTIIEIACKRVNTHSTSLNS